MWLVDLNYNFKCSWLIKLSDIKSSNNELSDNNLSSELVETISLYRSNLLFGMQKLKYKKNNFSIWINVKIKDLLLKRMTARCSLSSRDFSAVIVCNYISLPIGREKTFQKLSLVVKRL